MVMWGGMSKAKTKRCSLCGKKIRLLKDGTVGYHNRRALASTHQFMSRPDLDDYIITTHCDGSGQPPWKGRWHWSIGGPHTRIC